MKIGVVGCGAVGSYYGACLARAGHEVHFLVRSDYESVRDQGVQILSEQGDFRVRPVAARDPGAIGVCDWVIVGLKATSNRVLPQLIRAMADARTAVLTLQNGLGNEEALAQFLNPGQILGGLCFVCLNRVGPGVVRHIAHGRIVMGEFAGPPTDRTERLGEALRQAGIPCDLSPSLERAHWEKLVWNIPFNGLGVESALYDAAGARRSRREAGWTTDRLLSDPRWLDQLGTLMTEVMAASESQGHPIDPEFAVHQIERTRQMGSYSPSTLVDFEAGREMEIEAMFGEPLRRAQQAGVSVPRLSLLCERLWTMAKEMGFPM